ncbi:diacylglycerol O-acyltransferase 2-like isoform X4 [Apus apus]|uniref:diacylglycerol O-acyltransferase 2-like isoform X4 n=1 Tax=Apus apus TaxID=8895 RepID=UPI0021F91BDF|nr:diacylglycerol O-acyltransferase 2-like isoform X4 [Apus apus]
MKTIIAACSQNLSGSRASIQTALRTLLVSPWPSRWDVRSWLQLLSVLQWVLSFLLLGAVSLLLLIYLVFTSFWPISALYLAWIIFDWDTPEKGGRRLPCLRRWPVWRHFRDYFPVKLVKTHDLSPSHNYIIGSHPHGILCVGAFCNFITGSTGFGGMFPGIRPYLTTLAGNFRLPVFREYLMSGGERLRALPAPCPAPCTLPAPCLHPACTLHLHPAPALPLHCTLTLPELHPHPATTLPTPCLHPACTLPALHPHPASTLTLSSPCPRPACPLPELHPHFASTQSAPCLCPTCTLA